MQPASPHPHSWALHLIGIVQGTAFPCARAASYLTICVPNVQIFRRTVLYWKQCGLWFGCMNQGFQFNCCCPQTSSWACLHSLLWCHSSPWLESLSDWYLRAGTYIFLLLNSPPSERRMWNKRSPISAWFHGVQKDSLLLLDALTRSISNPNLFMVWEGEMSSFC